MFSFKRTHSIMLRILPILLFPICSMAQDFSGLWKGYFEAGENKVSYEVLIVPGTERAGGYAMTSMIIEGDENIGIKEISLKMKKNGLELEDAELVFSDFSKPGKRMMLTALLQPGTHGKSATLEGKFRTRSLDFRDKSYYTGNIYLQKTENNVASVLLAKLQEMKLYPVSQVTLTAGVETEMSRENKNQSTLAAASPKKDISSPGKEHEKVVTPGTANDMNVANSAKKDKEKVRSNVKSGNKPTDQAVTSPAPSAALPPAAFISSRKKEIINTFHFLGDSVEIVFYDNGTVDGDTITVLVDNRILLARKQLDIKPLREMISIPAGTDSLELTMYAENLGSLPPNTGLLIIRDGKSRHEIRFAGDLSKSSSVMLVRKK